MRRTHLLLLVGALVPVLAFAAGGALDRAPVRIYVSPEKGNDGYNGTQRRPVKSIARGLACARDVRSDAPREVVLADGVYELEKPLRLNGHDIEVTLRAEHPGKAVLSGGARLAGWVPDESDPRLLVAKLPFEPDPDAILFLTVGGEHREVAAYPEGARRLRYSGSGNTQLNYDPSDFPKDFDMGLIDIKSAWAVVPQEWASTSSRSSCGTASCRRPARRRSPTAPPWTRRSPTTRSRSNPSRRPARTTRPVARGTSSTSCWRTPRARSSALSPSTPRRRRGSWRLT